MNARLVRRTRWVVAGTLAGLLSAAFVVPQTAQAVGPKKTESDDKTYKQVAHVKVEIKQESGKVVKSTGVVDWGADGRIELAGDAHTHAVLVKIERDVDSKKKVSITVGYDRDGEALIAPYTFESTVKKREVIEIEGGIAIALQVTPKKVAVDAPPPEEKPEEREEKLKIGGDNNDPLGGLD